MIGAASQDEPLAKISAYRFVHGVIVDRGLIGPA
jgi:hypothetical protein